MRSNIFPWIGINFQFEFCAIETMQNIRESNVFEDTGKALNLDTLSLRISNHDILLTLFMSLLKLSFQRNCFLVAFGADTKKSMAATAGWDLNLHREVWVIAR